ncbi:AMP-binding enzyme [Rhodococcus opacus]|uniref:AMP-binding enzyme n=1 Tax=Rhodococcus opacus TaxID=37919 RepID=UPI003D26E3AD
MRECDRRGPRAAPHDALGELPIAFIVAADDSGIDEGDLRSRCAAALSYSKVPAEIIAVPEIPRTGSGKLQRHRLHRPKSVVAE